MAVLGIFSVVASILYLVRIGRPEKGGHRTDDDSGEKLDLGTLLVQDDTLRWTDIVPHLKLGDGNAGSGGAVRLVWPVVSGSGSARLYVNGGAGAGPSRWRRRSGSMPSTELRFAGFPFRHQALRSVK